jgi:hypothetical protein
VAAHGAHLAPVLTARIVQVQPAMPAPPIVRLGFAGVIETPAGPVRPAGVRITAAGRRALRAWFESEPAPPQLEFEAVLRLFYADAADKEAVLATLDQTRNWVDERYAEGIPLVETWLAGEAPFPERLHISALVAVFTRDLSALRRN